MSKYNMEDFSTLEIVKFKDYNFFIDDYQRGYKWTVQQIIDLLKDIEAFDPAKECFYCLQPLAVKKRNDDETKIFNADKVFEVIDGQQRLTTIHIIFKIIDEPLYNIKYQTREASAKFLDKIEEKLKGYSLAINGNIDDIKKDINEKWRTFVEDERDFDNIDIYHFFGAFLVIKAWFSNRNKEEFLKKLKNDTRFIWYEDIKQENSKKVFRDLNSGKIELTNAELIKALFINSLKNDNKEIQDLKQTELALEWDQIEQVLHSEDFWYFISNETDKNKYPTRIDYLFELIVGKSKDKNDKLYSYRQYAEEKEKLDWQKIKLQFLQLKEWFENRELYHLIGFIIYRKIKSINDIIKISKKAYGKEDFRNKLYGLIKDEFAKKDNEGKLIYDLENLTYHKPSYNRTASVLLLFNIETYQKSEAHFRFPFDRFKNEKWNLEHIHAKGAKDFKTVAELKAWVQDIEILLEDWNKKELSKPKEFDDEFMKLKKSYEDITDGKIKISDEQRETLAKLIEYTDGFFDVDSIKNLALLDGNTNTALQNKPYKEKREKIIKIDKQKWKDGSKKHFIPLCTKNVFLKYYTEEIKQMEYWGYQDREDYLESIKETLEDYLP